ncbi:class I SAM-dependent methyltransferase [Pseudomonadales bacterium]|nr:class I SAM-dependent methyltransferase [Pseudomonadales bacterium]
MNSMETTASYKSFLQSPYRSIKHASYFSVYDTLLNEYRGKNITFVEIGVLDGGSLFMWRDFFGENARIIGIEINKSAKVWEEHGFEIFIGSQSDPEFWKGLFNKVGNVDIVLDDGGHTYQQQIVTVESSLQYIKPGGKIIVEDTYTSYQKEYGSPSNYSFMKYAANLVDGMNLRTPKVKTTKKVNNIISNVTFFESIVSIGIQRDEGIEVAHGISNNGKILGKPVESMRYADTKAITILMGVIFAFKSLKNIPVLGNVVKSVGVSVSSFLKKLNNKIDNFKLRKYFRY